MGEVRGRAMCYGTGTGQAVTSWYLPRNFKDCNLDWKGLAIKVVVCRPLLQASCWIVS